MSRRKDRERFLQLKQLNPEYKGFRGGEAGGAGADIPLETVTCSQCGRRRNVAVGIALEQGESYICLSCREEQGEAIPADEAAER